MTSTTNPPLPSPPFFTVPNINNLRDAALAPPSGLKTRDGSKIRPGLLFRSAEVSKLDLAGWTTLLTIGIAHVFDLRSKPEVERGWEGTLDGTDSTQPSWISDLQAAGLTRHWTPVFESSDYSPERLAERYVKYMDEGEDGFVHAYEDILKHAGPAYKEIFTYLASLPPAEKGEGQAGFLSNDPEAPIPTTEARGALVHCTAGKDRTGMFFGILFSFLGVSDEDIADEYHLTEIGLGHLREDIVARLSQSAGFKQYMLSQAQGKQVSAEEIAEALKGGADIEVPQEILDKGRNAALRMVGARKESMLRTLKLVEREWGSAEGYLRKVVGLGDEELEGLRKALVVPA